MTHLSIQTEYSKYPLFIGSDNLPKIGEIFQLYKFGSNIAFIIDENLKGGYTSTLLHSFAKIKIPFIEIYLPSNENSKSLKTIHQLCDTIISRKNIKPDTIVAFGGGFIADVAGFATKLFQPTMKYIQIPTTLTAQIQSSTMEHAYLNINSARNAVSVDCLLHLVWCDIGLLRSLPTNEFMAGLGFVLQHCLLNDGNLFNLVQQHLDKILRKDLDVLEKIVHRCAEINLTLLRSASVTLKSVNLGTLIATAIEELTDFQIVKFGEALIWGLYVECLVANRAGFLNNQDFENINNLLNHIKPNVTKCDINSETVFNVVKDKMIAKKLKVPLRFGEFKTINHIDDHILMDSIKNLQM